MIINLKNKAPERTKFVNHFCKGNEEPQMSETTTKKKRTTRSKKSSDKQNEVILEPVVVRVQRTVREKANKQPANDKSTSDQEHEPDDVDLDTIEIRKFVTEPAKVTYNYGISRSVQFQSVNVGVSVTIPCYKEEIEDAIAEAKDFCAKRLKVETAKVDGVLKHLVDLRVKADRELNQRGIA